MKPGVSAEEDQYKSQEYTHLQSFRKMPMSEHTPCTVSHQSRAEAVMSLAVWYDVITWQK